MYERIVVALDGSELAVRALPCVEPLAQTLGSTLLLLRVVEPAGAADRLVGAADVTERERRTAEYLRGVAGRLQERGCAVLCEQRRGDPAETIVRVALELEAGLVAMTTHGRGGLGRALRGSVADAVLRGAPCPVLLVRVDPDKGGLA